MSVEDEVHRLLEPIVATLGIEVLEVEFTGGTLRVIADEGDGITTGRLAEVNRLISPILDQHDPVPGRYTLEVSSPGLERPLRRLDHYRRAIGEEIVVKMIPEVEPRRVKGRLVAVGAAPPDPLRPQPSSDAAADVTIAVEVTEVDGVALDEPDQRELDLAGVASARTVFTWGPAPKPGKPGSGRAGKRSDRPGSRRPDRDRTPESSRPRSNRPHSNRPHSNREVSDEQ
jgi:ribosome maturation factor RimP